MQGSTGGTNQKRMAAQWPALKKRKISQTVFTLDPCAMRPAHVHQRADGLLYVISGAPATLKHTIACAAHNIGTPILKDYVEVLRCAGNSF